MRRWIFWEFPRGSWQYDIIVAALLAFIFLTPRDLFRDQPRASGVVLVPSPSGARVYYIEQDALAPIPEDKRMGEANRLIAAKYKENAEIVRVEPLYDSENDVKGFLAYAKH